MAQKNLFIIPVADVHYGSDHSDRVLFEKIINSVARKDNFRLMLLGDLIEVSQITGKSDPWHSDPDEIFHLADILSKVKGKVLGVIDGNHEARIAKIFGIEIGKLFARETSSRYGGNIIRHQIGGTSIFAHHGVGMGRTVGSVVNNLYRLYEIDPTCDVYISGHRHQPVYFTKTNCSGSLDYYVTKHFVGVSSFCRWPEYSQKKAMPPSSVIGTAIEVHRNGVTVHFDEWDRIIK